jgi:tripartite-type tricarboxylate transporter receptor subunit TctC
VARLLGVLACVIAAGAHAQSAPPPGPYPTKPAKVLVGYAPGGPNDIIARAYALRLSDALGQPFLVENRSGAAGNLAAEAVAKSAPDGYTLLQSSTSTDAVNPWLYTKLGFDLVRDLAIVAYVASGNSALAVRADLPAKSVRELIALAKKEPGRLTYASSGAGSSLHLAGELFKQRAGVDLVHVPYKGAAPAMADLVAGRVDMSFAPVANVVPLAKAGKLRLLGLTGAKPSAFAPGIPSLGGSGLPGFDVFTTYSVLVRTGTPEAVMDRLNAELRRIAGSEEMKGQLALIGVEPETSASPAAAQAQRMAELEKWGKLVRAIGLKAD